MYRRSRLLNSATGPLDSGAGSELVLGPKPCSAELSHSIEVAVRRQNTPKSGKNRSG